jgi:hypothetical protein
MLFRNKEGTLIEINKNQYMNNKLYHNQIYSIKTQKFNKINEETNISNNMPYSYIQYVSFILKNKN